VLVEFPVERFGRYARIGRRAAGAVAAGIRVTLLDTGESGLMGYDGQCSFRRYGLSNRVSAETDAGRCES